MKNRILLGLSSKKKLAHFLQCSNRDLKELASDKYYKEHHDTRHGLKSRTYEVPFGKLRKAHELIFNELRKEIPPFWFFSCKGKGYIANAAFHAKSNIYLLKMDISKFYPSCKRAYVFNVFKDKNYYALPGDIAGLIADILTYKGHIPTGSPVSGLLAFWSYYDCFNEIYLYSKTNNFEMSLYVDDITFSGEKHPTRLFRRKIRDILNRYGLQSNDKKLKIYKTFLPKLVTGVIIKPPGTLSIPNKLNKKIIDKLKHVKQGSRKDLLCLIGLKNAAAQIVNFENKMDKEP